MRAAASLLARLRAARNTFGAAAERDKRALLRALSAAKLATSAQVSALHEDLLFICAFPGHRAATRALARRMLARHRRPRPRAPAGRSVSALDDSGIAESIDAPRLSVSRRALGSRARRPPTPRSTGATSTTRRCSTRSSGRCCTDGEREAFDSGEFAHARMDRGARGAPMRGRTSEWLMHRRRPPAPARSDSPTRGTTPRSPWRGDLRESRASVTHNALAGVAAVARAACAGPRTTRSPTSRARCRRSSACRARGAQRVVDGRARGARRAVPRSERDDVSQPDEVWWCDLGEGAALAVIGIAPAHRLTLETNTGYLLFANGVPIGYGGVTPLYRQANTGINIFDPFRGSEAAFLWTQMLRAFHTLYGSGRFVINAYQFGAGNAEAIASGAFWFYYRLGFRPARRAGARLAAREARAWPRTASTAATRATLRALASATSTSTCRDSPTTTTSTRRCCRTSARSRRARSRASRCGRARARRGGSRSAWPRTSRSTTSRVGRPRERRGFEFLAPAVAAPARPARLAGGRPRGARRDAAGERRAAGTRLRAQGAARAALLRRDARRAACVAGNRRPPALNARARRRRPSPQPSPRVAGRGRPSARCPRQASDDGQSAPSPRAAGARTGFPRACSGPLERPSPASDGAPCKGGLG